jgi:hypothetical protein
MSKIHQWTFTPAKEMSRGKYLGIIEFQDRHGEYHTFEVIATPRRIVFGGVTNTGFLERGYMPRDNTFSLDENLQEMLEDLEVYYNDGKRYVSRIIVNERM